MRTMRQRRGWQRGAAALVAIVAGCASGATDGGADSANGGGTGRSACIGQACANGGGGGRTGSATSGTSGGESGAGTPSGATGGPTGGSASGVTSGSDASRPPVGQLPRVVAYVNCMCGFGVGTSNGECLAAPDPAVNQVKAWEDDGSSPITHYVISFLSFQGGEIQTDPGAIWEGGGGSTSNFALAPNLRDAMKSAQAHGKKVMLSLGGELGSSGFVGWWQGRGATSADRVAGMRAKLQSVAQKFAQANGVNVDGYDVDIELGGVYAYGSVKYESTRDLIAAVPDEMLVAFVPQVGNGLCAAPVVGDTLTPPQVLGGQCQQPVNGDDSPWVLARLDKDVKRANGSPKLDWFGIQYYNAGQAECCGGGGDARSMAVSAAQNYKNLANGWPASGDTTEPQNPWHAWAWYPGAWAKFGGIGPERLVLGKPGCQGCAGSDYMDVAGMHDLIARLDGHLKSTMGGLLFWDLCRLFGNQGRQCVSGQCQPSWGGADVKKNLSDLRAQMVALKKGT